MPEPAVPQLWQQGPNGLSRVELLQLPLQRWGRLAERLKNLGRSRQAGLVLTPGSRLLPLLNPFEVVALTCPLPRDFRDKGIHLAEVDQQVFIRPTWAARASSLQALPCRFD